MTVCLSRDVGITRLRFLSLALPVSVLTSVVAPEPSADPRLASWLVTPSVSYARLYESGAAKAAGKSVVTWNRRDGAQASPSNAGVALT